jgi:hypothetical protein
MPPVRAAEVARLLATGTWTHDHPLQPPELATLGLPVRVGRRQPRARADDPLSAATRPHPRGGVRPGSRHPRAASGPARFLVLEGLSTASRGLGVRA